MPLFNGDIVFIDSSGQIRSLDSDLYLKSDDGNIVVKLGSDLLPEVNNQQNLGNSQSGWLNIHAVDASIAAQLGIAIPEGQSLRCSLDVSGLICASGLEIVGSRPTLSGVGLATLDDISTTTSTSGFNMLSLVGSNTGSNITSIDLMEGGSELRGPGIAILKNTEFKDVAVDFLHDGSKNGGTWILELQKFVPESGYITQATFDVATEE